MSKLCTITINSIKDDQFIGDDEFDHTRKDPPQDPRAFTVLELSDLLDLHENNGAKNVRYNVIKSRTKLYPIERLRGTKYSSMDTYSNISETMSIFGKCAAECLSYGKCKYEILNSIGIQKGDKLSPEKLREFEKNNQKVEGLGAYKIIVQMKTLSEGMRDDNQGRGYIESFDENTVTMTCIGRYNSSVKDAKFEGDRMHYPFQHGERHILGYDEIVFDGVILNDLEI